MSPARFRTTIAAAALAMVAALPIGSAGAATPGDLAPGFNPLARAFAGSGNETATGVAVRHDGRIVVSTVAVPELDRRIVGLRADGSLDPTFSEDGVWHMPQPNQSTVRALATTPDGKVVFAGDDASQHTIVIGRLMADGELDPTFGGGDGLAVFSGGDQSVPQLEWVEVQPDGKIIFAGDVSTPTAGRELIIGRLNANGTDDTGFPGSPFTTLGFPGAINDQFAGIARMTNGEWAVAVSHETAATGVIRLGPKSEYRLVKDLDAASGVEFAADVASMGGTKAVVMSNVIANPTVLMMVDMSATPRIDTGWGSGGVTRPFPSNFKGEQLVAQPGGKLLVAGYRDGQRAIARVLPNGSLDTAFGSGGIRVLDGGTSAFPGLRTHELAETADGSILSASQVSGAMSTMVAVHKLTGRIARLRAEVAAPNLSPKTGVDTPMLLRVHNAGPDASGQVKVSFSTSPGLAVVSSNGPCRYTSATSGDCTLANVAPNATTTITLQVRTAIAGAHSLGMHLGGATFDDNTNDDTAMLMMSFAAPAPAVTTPPPSKPGGAGGAKPATSPGGAQTKPPRKPRKVRMVIRRTKSRGGRMIRCGYNPRTACVTSRVRPRRRPVPMWMRITARPVPGTAKRRVLVALQRKEGRRWVKRGDGSLDLRWNGTLDLTVPNDMRHERSIWRLRVYAGRTRTTLATRSPWFYIRVR